MVAIRTGRSERFPGKEVNRDTSKISISGKKLLTNRKNGEGQLCHEKYNCKKCKPSEVSKHYEQWARYYTKHMSNKKVLPIKDIKMKNNELRFDKVDGFRFYDGTRCLILFGPDAIL